jgi:hypothetical protein
VQTSCQLAALVAPTDFSSLHVHNYTRYRDAIISFLYSLHSFWEPFPAKHHLCAVQPLGGKVLPYGWARSTFTTLSQNIKMMPSVDRALEWYSSLSNGAESVCLVIAFGVPFHACSLACTIKVMCIRACACHQCLAPSARLARTMTGINVLNRLTKVPLRYMVPD